MALGLSPALVAADVDIVDLLVTQEFVVGGLGALSGGRIIGGDFC